MTFDQLAEVAKNEGWTRKQVRRAMHAENDPALWARRDEMMAVLGLATTEQTAVAAQAAESVQRAAAQAAEAARQAAAETAARQRRLAEQVQREQAEAKAAELAEYQAAERTALAAVEPHWPTYRRVLDLARDCREYRAAARYRDVGDMMAFKDAAPALMHVAELVMLDDRSVAADILRKTGGAMTEPQAKLVGLILAKLATANGMSGPRAVSPDTAHRQERVTAELEEIAVTLDRSLDQRVELRFIATKKTGKKPYLAKLGPGFSREFAGGRKATNTTKMFLAEARIGDVFEFRGYNWDGEAYIGGVEYAVVANGAVYLVSRTAAAGVLDGGTVLVIDRETPVIRLHPEAPVPAELADYQGGLSAWLLGADGEPLAVTWPAEMGGKTV